MNTQQAAALFSSLVSNAEAQMTTFASETSSLQSQVAAWQAAILILTDGYSNDADVAALNAQLASAAASAAAMTATLAGASATASTGLPYPRNNDMQPNYQTIFDGGMLVIVIVAAIATWQNSKSAKRSDEETHAMTAIKIGDATITALTSENNFLKAQNAKYGERMAVLESENTKLHALIQNRNPELELFMKSTGASLLIIERSIEALLKAQPASITVNNQPNG